MSTKSQKVVSQNLSIMMTDIQGYTDTSSASSRQEIIQLIRNHNRLMVPVIQFYGGTIIKSIGDALLVTFNSATDAVVCGIVIQLILKEYNRRQREEGKKMGLRVVINSGDVTLENNDIFGDAVNITARMEGLPCFPGGTIGISESTFLLMNRNEIVADLIGPQQMKGIPLPINVYMVPLEKQRLNEIPTRLLELVEHVVQNQGSLTSEFDSEINKFLQYTKNDNANTSEDHSVASPVVTPPHPAELHAGDKTKQLAPTKASPPKKLVPTTPATHPQRFKGFLIDFLVMLTIMEVFMILGPLVIVLYFTLSWKYRNATFGQLVFDLEIQTKSGQNLGFFGGLIRMIFLFISPFFFFMAFFGKGELIQDIVASTTVDKKLEPPEPENTFTRATIKDRVKSFLLDCLIIIVLLIIFKPTGGLAFTILYLTLFWKYKGSSIGQSVYDLEIKQKTGEPLGFFRALLRAFAFCLSPFFFFLSFTGNGELLQDIAAGTVVTKEIK